ncbi:hypothetical protein [Subtercola sp. YIM 133946]|uniref:hypothetical protein n=1 Tax=Subtercola sp. YIM 133946 TaxID=3118909 RepID=UPI002F9338C8
MMGWRRKAKAEREKVMSAEALYDLVNQTLLSNFGPLGSYAITRRAASDNDDIFHTILASSVAHNIVTNLIEHKAVVVQSSVPVVSLAPVDAVPVPQQLADAVTELRPVAPLAAEQPVRLDAATAAVAELADAELERAAESKLSVAN